MEWMGAEQAEFLSHERGGHLKHRLQGCHGIMSDDRAGQKQEHPIGQSIIFNRLPGYTGQFFHPLAAGEMHIGQEHQQQ
jgi:hypothetical protein